LELAKRSEDFYSGFMDVRIEFLLIMERIEEPIMENDNQKFVSHSLEFDLMIFNNLSTLMFHDDIDDKIWKHSAGQNALVYWGDRVV
jgi:hypothetical protein